jgi:long-chain acyl-CoA synthetase
MGCGQPDDWPAGDPRFLRFEDLLQKGRDLLLAGHRGYIDHTVDTQAMAALLFTSGTTAQAKGVMLSQDNLCSNIRSITGVLRIDPGERLLSILPLHHSFENTVGTLTILYYGGCICYCDGLRYFLKNMQEWQIEVMVSVPLLFENIYKKLTENIAASGKTRQVALLRPLVRSLKRIGIDVRRQVFRRLIETLGGKLRMVVIGAAAIDQSIIQAFNDFGLTFYMGYGLTESAPCVASCNHKVNIPGSVGAPIAEVEVAIDTPDDEPGAIGEILTRSGSVMLGYYQDPEATAEVLQPDGWLRTGDMGYFNRRGALHLTGRAKSMIVLSNGKKAFPEEIETMLMQIPGLVESMVWGEPGDRDNVDICALLRVDHATLPQPAGSSPQQIGAWLSGQLKEVNHAMPSYKAIRYFLFTEADLAKTTTLKLKRQAQLEQLHQTIARCQLTMRGASGRQLESLE